MEPLHLFRTYGSHSGAAFDDHKGFTAQASGLLFDPAGKQSAAKEILQNHLKWNNRHIPSPLISASTSAKSKRMAAAFKRRNESVVSIAEILYDPQEHHSATCYNLCSLAETLGVVIPEHCKDKDEYVFVGFIPLECIVEVRRVSSWTKKNQPSSFSPYIFPKSINAQCATIAKSTARVSDCGTPSFQASRKIRVSYRSKTKSQAMMVSLSSVIVPSIAPAKQPSKHAKEAKERAKRTKAERRAECRAEAERCAERRAKAVQCAEHRAKAYRRLAARRGKRHAKPKRRAEDRAKSERRTKRRAQRRAKAKRRPGAHK